MVICMALFGFFFSSVEKDNNIARSIVLRKSDNWDSPASILQAENGMTQLYKRERKKREKKACISVQQPVEPDLQLQSSTISEFMKAK